MTTTTATVQEGSTLEHEKNNDDKKTSTTRVCVKNLPSSFQDESKLIDHFVKNAKVTLQVTDCKILKKDGKSRKMAFIGFKTPEMATHVVSRFHQTFCLTSKLSVEPAFSKKDVATQHRPWSKHSKGSSRYEKLHKKEKSSNDKKNNDEESSRMENRKQDFLSVLGDSTTASSKPKFWANDDEEMAVNMEQDAGTNVRGKEDDNVKDKDESSSDDSTSSDEDSDNDSVDSGGEGANVMVSFQQRAAQGSVLTDFLKSKVTGTDNLEEEEEDDNDEKEAASVQERYGNDDDSSTSSSSSAVSCSSSDESDKDDEPDDKNAPKKNHQSISIDTGKSTTMESPSESGEQPDKTCTNRLFCRNLPFGCTEDELRDVFVQFGAVTECHIALDDLKRSKGFGFVSMASVGETQQALAQLDGTDFQGRLLHIMPAKQRIDDNSTIGDTGNLTYKQQQEAQRKQNASQTTVGANASFVRGDAVVDNLSQRLGLNKGDILNVKDGLGSGDAAVRLALGETHIIEENRQYFGQHGIDMDALVSGNNDDKSSTKRSSTSILVKNLPYDTVLEDMTKLFRGVGGDAPRRILLPPSRTIALVEYGHAVDARRAFRKLAYRRFKHVPLYLEWAPLASIDTEKDNGITTNSKPHDSVAQDDQSTMVKETIKRQQDEEAVAEADEPSISHTIYVKNLNFATTEEQLRQVFEKKVKSIRAVKIPTKAAPVKRIGNTEGSSKPLSMGYGFVECDSDESVRKAIKALQGALVDGHALELKRSSKQLVATKPAAPKDKNPTKLMVRNVPFQATRKELLQLFGSFGQLKKVRLPKKFDGSHRGFAFVEFLTSQEAQTAMTSLSRTHLYGRHLVLEWASDNDDISELRDKAKRDVFGSESAQRKNKKIRFE